MSDKLLQLSVSQSNVIVVFRRKKYYYDYLCNSVTLSSTYLRSTATQFGIKPKPNIPVGPTILNTVSVGLFSFHLFKSGKAFVCSSVTYGIG